METVHWLEMTFIQKSIDFIAMEIVDLLEIILCEIMFRFCRCRYRVSGVITL